MLTRAFRRGGAEQAEHGISTRKPGLPSGDSISSGVQDRPLTHTAFLPST